MDTLDDVVNTLLKHPFYLADIGKYRDRPRRPMIEVNEKGCFIWQGTSNSKGYPTRGVGGALVHRMAWIAFNGAIPDGYEIHHACAGCPNKMCIRIDHLMCLSPEEHRLIEGRPLKLNPAKVREILLLVVAGVPRRVIAAQYDIKPHYVTEIKNAKVWKNVVRDFWRERGAWPVRGRASLQVAA